MKPGSSDRCKAKSPDGRLRCHRHKGHADSHQAPTNRGTTYWYTTDGSLVLQVVHA